MRKSSAKTSAKEGSKEAAAPASPDDLAEYRDKRDPGATNEPFTAERKPSGERETHQGAFVVHQHDASRSHYDLRIQIGSSLASFAVPRGPSLDPADKRLAVQVESHPIEYLDFEDVIPAGQYGAGPMIAWDTGRISYLEGSAEAGLEGGEIKFELYGQKLKGRFTVVKTSGRGTWQPRGSAAQPQWLLIKKEDEFSTPGKDVTEERPRSILSGLTIRELERKAEIAGELERLARDVGGTVGAVDVRHLVPMYCTVTDAPFDRKGWIYELKLDGVRIVADKQGDEVALRYRSKRAATSAYPEIARAVRALAPDRVVLDGEIVAFDAHGRPNFHRLGTRIHVTTPYDVRRAAIQVPVVFLVFDVLALGDYDLRDVPLVKRKELLASVVRGDGLVRPLDHIEDGRLLFEFSKQNEIEGVVAKRGQSKYREGPKRSEDWIKVKRERDGEFVVVGWVESKGSGGALGALELASWADGELVLRGRVGSGLSENRARELLPLLRSIEIDQSPATGPIQPAGAARHFTEPKLVASVRYAGWGDSGHLRFPVYRGLREDVDPKDCTMAPGEELLERASEAAGAEETTESARTAERAEAPLQTKVLLSNQDKVFWPDEGYTKGQLCQYYASISDAVLPFLKNRPVMLVRHPDGIYGKSFYQWRPPKGTPDWLRTFQVKSEERDGKNVSVFMMDSPDALLHIANLGCIPLHVLASRVDSLLHCDFITLDLDLAGNPFSYAVRLARSLKELLDEIGFVGYPKTSGQTGLHVLIPVGPGVSFEAAKILVELVGRLLLVNHTDIATMERIKGKRGGKVLIDIGQTGRSRTIVGPYSVRATPGARVSTPLAWDEVHLALDPAKFDMFTVPQRVVDTPDPLEGFLEQRPDVPGAVAKMEKMMGAG